MTIIATLSITFRCGYDQSMTQNVNALFDENTTLAEVFAWAKQYNDCDGVSNIELSTPTNDTTATTNPNEEEPT